MSLGLKVYAPAEWMGQGEVGWCAQWVQTGWLLLGLAVERLRKQPSGLVHFDNNTFFWAFIGRELCLLRTH